MAIFRVNLVYPWFSVFSHPYPEYPHATGRNSVYRYWSVPHFLTLTAMKLSMEILKQTFYRLGAFPVAKPTASEH